MASFTIPLVFTAEPKPDQHFSLNVADARRHPDSIQDFASVTWASCNSKVLFLGDRFRKFQRPSVKEIVTQRGSTFRRRRFEPFARLPVELQDKIWESTLEPVTHTVLCLVEVGGLEYRICSKTWLLESPGKKSDRRTLPVPLFHICRQSRAVAHRFYRLLEPGVYFSPVIDTLRLSIVSSTKIIRERNTDRSRPGDFAYRAVSSSMRGPFFAGDAFFEEMRDGRTASGSKNSNCNYSYHPLYKDWTTSYKTHLHDYGPPYILSRLSPRILEEVQNLEVLFYYEPLLSIENQENLSHLFTYFMQEDCPILDLAGLRRLALKVAVVTYSTSLNVSEPEGSEAWSQLIHRILDLPNLVVNKKKQKSRQERGLGRLQCFEITKVCAVVRDVYYINRRSSFLSAQWYQMRRRVLTKLCGKNWRPS